MLDELVSDPKLRAVLLAQRANYGGTTATEMSFGVHALIMRHYFNGAYYPVGGAKGFADALIPVIEQAGGELKLKAKVRELLVENETVVGVQLAAAYGREDMLIRVASQLEQAAPWSDRHPPVHA